MQSTLHSRLPSILRSHSKPTPVHSFLSTAISSAAARAAAFAVELSMSATVSLKALLLLSSSWRIGRVGRGWNQLLPRSKKQRSDQLHEVRKRMSRRTEQ